MANTIDEKDIDLVVTFDTETGLKVNTHSKILEALKNLTYYSFGSDFSIEEGTEWFSFIDLMAKSLANVGGAVKNVYDSIGFINASGQTLDNAVSLAGITRNGLVKSYVNVSISRETTDSGTTIISSPIQVRDTNDNLWVCNEDIIFEGETTEVTKVFHASDSNKVPSYNLAVDSDVYLYSINPLPNGVYTFKTITASVKGREKEEDSQLKYRYYSALYNQSTATLDGLRSKLLSINDLNLTQIDAKPILSPLNYVYIYNNTKNELDDTYNVPAHSIWVIVDGISSKNDDETIAKIIYNYKSLGCGTSYGKSTYLTGTSDNEQPFAKSIEIVVEDTRETVYFSRAESTECYVSLKLKSSKELEEDSNKKLTIETNIKNNLVNYINNLGIHIDVLFSGVAKVIYDLQTTSGYEDFVFDITDIKIGNSNSPTTTMLPVDIYQYAHINSENIIITWE